jgi:opacity protein-like surface antigen
MIASSPRATSHDTTPVAAAFLDRHCRCAIIAPILAVCLVTPLRAQSAQPFSLQLAALFTTIRASTSGSSVAGAGFEPQLRFNRLLASEKYGALSLGLGGQYTVHTKVQDKLTITGVFLEPRWVPATNFTRVFPYLSARLSLLHVDGDFQFADGGSSTGSGIGAGGGVAVRITRTVNLDAGVQLVQQRFGKIGTVTFRPFATYTAKIGATFGFPP